MSNVINFPSGDPEFVKATTLEYQRVSWKIAAYAAEQIASILAAAQHSPLTDDQRFDLQRHFETTEMAMNFSGVKKEFLPLAQHQEHEKAFIRVNQISMGH